MNLKIKISIFFSMSLFRMPFKKKKSFCLHIENAETICFNNNNIHLFVESEFCLHYCGTVHACSV